MEGFALVGVDGLGGVVVDALCSLFLAEEFDYHLAASFLDVVSIAVVQDCDEEFGIRVLAGRAQLLLAVPSLDQNHKDSIVQSEAVVVLHQLDQLRRYRTPLTPIILAANFSNMQQVRDFLMDNFLVGWLGDVLQHFDQRRQCELRAKNATVDRVCQVPGHFGIPFVLRERLGLLWRLQFFDLVLLFWQLEGHLGVLIVVVLVAVVVVVDALVEVVELVGGEAWVGLIPEALLVSILVPLLFGLELLPLLVVEDLDEALLAD